MSSGLLQGFVELGNLQDTWRNGYRHWFPKLLKETIIWRLQVQSWLQVSNNTGILNTCIRLRLTESEQATPVASIKDVVQSYVNKHLKKAEGHIGQNVVEITIKMTMVEILVSKRDSWYGINKQKKIMCPYRENKKSFFP